MKAVAREVDHMQAELTIERIERRLSLDEISDAEWLDTTAETDDEGRLRIVTSCRYSDEDVVQYGAETVTAWIHEDRRRYQAFGQDWWFVNAQAVAVLGVTVKDERIGTVEVASGCLGGAESDAPPSYYGEITDELVAELTAQLKAQGLNIPEDVDTPFVCSDPCVVRAL
jgi:glycerol-3-phosphate cytidylyltransferase-like family protein